MKRYDVKEELTKSAVIETEAENNTEEETVETDEEVPKKEIKKSSTVTYSSKPRPVKLDITFIVIGIVITIAIPLAAVFFFELTKTGIILLIVCVGLLDALCFLAHKLMNKRIEV